MDVFKVRKIRETGSTSIGTLDSVHQDIVQTLRESKLKKDEKVHANRDKIKQLIDQAKASLEVRVRKGTKRYWRVVVKAMMMFKKLFKDSVKSKLAEREAIVEAL